MRLFLRQALLLSFKDTRLFLKDRFALGFALLFPILFIVAFSLALGDIGPEDEPLQMAVALPRRRAVSRARSSTCSPSRRRNGSGRVATRKDAGSGSA